jgi:hypothetical protein
VAIAYVQQSATADGAAGNTLSTAATTNPVAVGDCLVLVIESLSAIATVRFVTGVTDNGGNTWPSSAAARIGDNNSGGRSSEIWVLPNAKAKSGYTTTTTFSGATTESRITVVEFSGVASASPVDTSGTAATANGGATVQTLAVSTGAAITNAGDLLVTNLCISTGVAASGITVPTSTTSIELDQNDSTSISCGSAYEILSGASLTVKTLTWNWSGSGSATNVTTACIVALLPAGTATFPVGQICV